MTHATASAPGAMRLPRLMLVTDRRRTRDRSLQRCAALTVAGGVGLVQLREKDLPDGSLLALLDELRAELPRRTMLVVNDRDALARARRVGLHLPSTRAALTAGERDALSLVGRSVHDTDEARRAVAEQIDYLVLGTIYATASKPGRTGAGPGIVARVCRLVAPLPVYAIGGVTPDRVTELLRAGAHGVAVSGALLEAADPTATARAFSLALSESAGRPG